MNIKNTLLFCRSSSFVNSNYNMVSEVGSMLVIASTFRGSGLRPLALMILPKKGISVHLILHLSALKRRPVSRARSMTALRFASWLLRSWP